MKKIYILLIAILPLITVMTLAVGYPGDGQEDSLPKMESHASSLADTESSANILNLQEAININTLNGAEKLSISNFLLKKNDNVGMSIPRSFNSPSGVTPLTVLNLHGTASNGKVQLMFNTSNETNVFRYHVESSVDGRFWDEISAFSSKGNDYGSSYQFTDTRHHQGLIYYRIKATALDGSYKYSNTILLTTRMGSRVELMATVVTSTLGFYITDPNPVRLNVLVYGTDGKLYSKATVQHNNGRTNFSIPVGQLYRGNYVVRFIGEDGFSHSARFLKQ